VLEKPRYGTARKCSYESKGIGVLRIPNIGQGRIDSSDLKFAEFSSSELSDLKLIEGDILIIRSNGSVSLVGQSAIVTKNEEAFVYAGYLIRLRIKDKSLNPRYLLRELQSIRLRKQIEGKAKSTSGVNNISASEICDLIIAICPLDEQNKVVEEIDSRLSLCDKLEESVAQSLERAEALRQCILKKAFEGKLVPQDSHDEPASALLERVRAEREAGNSKASRTKVNKPAPLAEVSLAPVTRKPGRPRKADIAETRTSKRKNSHGE
jgi:type I restriction enzyme S subunit